MFPVTLAPNLIRPPAEARSRSGFTAWLLQPSVLGVGGLALLALGAGSALLVWRSPAPPELEQVATVASLVEGMHHFSHDLGSSLSTVRRQAAELLLALSDYETLGSQELQELQQRESDPGIKALLCELAAAAVELK